MQILRCFLNKFSILVGISIGSSVAYHMGIEYNRISRQPARPQGLVVLLGNKPTNTPEIETGAMLSHLGSDLFVVQVHLPPPIYVYIYLGSLRQSFTGRRGWQISEYA